MKNLLMISLSILFAFNINAQDNIDVAVDECCECFTHNNTENKDSLISRCSIDAINGNFDGLVVDMNLEKFKDDQAFMILTERMLGYFQNCKAIRKYFKEIDNGYERSKI